MLDTLFLPIFPEGALAHSVTTCVWIGVWLIVLFNLRFGWVLTGLVVPGYLAPLVFVKPWAAAVVIFEAVVTYLLVYWFSERGSRLGVWSGLFGRDRFFALVLMSIAVRLVFDTWLLPEFASWLAEAHQLQFDFRNNLHSFGLVIICLLANQFWKTGLLRGIVPVAVPIVLTCLIVRFVLMEFTNFSIGNLNYIYEDVAASLLASPKSYIVLVVAAFIASRMNLHYGWDFNGILIPALLALQWYQPEKILVSFIEAAVILIAARAVLKLPRFEHVNVEGGRKLLLFFNISFAYKLLLGWGVLWLDLDVKATDYYGFGYLLPTLIAIKMHDKEIVARLSRATLQTSLSAVVLASVVAFALNRIDWYEPGLREENRGGSAVAARQTWKPLTELLKGETLMFYRNRGAENVNKPLALEIDRFSHGIRLLFQYVDSGSPELLEEAAGVLALLNFEVVSHPDWVLIREKEPSLGWGSYVIARQPRRALALEVPAPLEDGHLTQVGAHLFELYGASSMAVAGNQLRLSERSDPLSLIDQTSLFQAFHRVVGRGDVLQLRGLTPHNRERLGGEETLVASTSELRIDGRLPDALDLRTLEWLVGDVVTYFNAPEMANIQRQSAGSGFAELYLARESVRQLLYAALTEHGGESSPATALLRPQFLNEWVQQARGHIAARDSNAYEPLSQAELLYLDDQVLQPMLDWIGNHDTGLYSEEALQALAGINNAASVVRHQVGLLNGDADDPQLFLAPIFSEPVRHSAFVVVRGGAGSELVVMAPRPLAEPGSLEFALGLHNDTRARALIVSGTHVGANADGSSDVIRLSNKHSLFSLASQRLVRAAGEAPLTLAQVRGLGQQDNVARARADVLISQRFNRQGEDSPSPASLLAYLQRRGLTTAAVDGGPRTIGYENHLVLQNRYLDQSRNKSFLSLWVAREPRIAERFESGNRQLLAQLASLGLPARESSLEQRLRDAAVERPISEALDNRLRDYQRSGDVMVLAAALHSAPDVHFESLIDRRSQQLYLLVGRDRQQIAGAFLLGQGRGASNAVAHRRLAPGRLSPGLAEFVDQREALLTFGDPS